MDPVSIGGLSFAVVVAFFVPLVGLVALGFLIAGVICERKGRKLEKQAKLELLLSQPLEKFSDQELKALEQKYTS